MLAFDGIDKQLLANLYSISNFKLKSRDSLTLFKMSFNVAPLFSLTITSQQHFIYYLFPLEVF